MSRYEARTDYTDYEYYGYYGAAIQIAEIQLSSSRPDLLQPIPRRPLRFHQIERLLRPQKMPLRQGETAGLPQIRIRRDTTLAGHDLVDAAWRDMDASQGNSIQGRLARA